MDTARQDYRVYQPKSATPRNLQAYLAFLLTPISLQTSNSYLSYHKHSSPNYCSFYDSSNVYSNSFKGAYQDF